MKRVLLIALAFFTVTMFSCKKERVQPTQAEQTAILLKDVIQSKGIERVVATDFNGSLNEVPFSTGLEHSFDKGFITISGYGQALNLQYLQAYAISNIRVRDNQGKIEYSEALVLYFRF